MLKLDIDPKPQMHHLDVLTHRLVTSNFMGDYASVFKGKGIIFESYREYSPSDDASAIDWKASMRAGKTLVREFVEERNLEIFFLIDASHTMVFGSQKRLKHEYAAEMVASMSFAILDRGDSVGVGLFSDTLRGVLLPERGIAQYRRILHELANPEHYDRECDFAEAVRLCLQRLRPQTILIVVTDGVRLQGDWELLLKVANRKFEVLCILVRDPRDDTLPEGAGQVMVESAGTGQQMLLDCAGISEEYARAAREIKERNLAVMKRGQIADVPVIMTDTDFGKEIISFFERRKRRMR